MLRKVVGGRRWMVANELDVVGGMSWLVASELFVKGSWWLAGMLWEAVGDE
jgi:hypothetical protein